MPCRRQIVREKTPGLRVDWVQRDSLAPGSSISGPVIVEEFGSTVPIHPGFEVRVDEYLNLIVTRSEA